MNMKSYKAWILLGAAGGVGFGLFIAPLIYILVSLFFDGVTLNATVRFAVANGFTWGVLGLFLGVFFWAINKVTTRSEED